MSIKLYNMPGCHYCKKAKELFSDEIESGDITVVDSSQAPTGTNGFPFFVNTANGLTYMGFPGDKNTLYNKLNAALQPRENFTYMNTQPKNHMKNAWVGIV